MDFAEDFGAQVDTFLCIKCQDHPLTSVSHILTVSNYQICSDDEFDLWSVYPGKQFRASWPLDSSGVIKLARTKLD